MRQKATAHQSSSRRRGSVIRVERRERAVQTAQDSSKTGQSSEIVKRRQGRRHGSRALAAVTLSLSVFDGC